MHGSEKFTELVEIMARLRGPQGCPWDRAQTHASLRRYLLEETYEVLHALDAGDDEELCHELGDLLLQVVYHAQIAAEAGRFDIGAVIAAISAKMIRRHPHVFGDARVDSAAELTHLWEQIKQQEGKKNALAGVPHALPALQRAARLQQKAGAAAASVDEVEATWQTFRAAAAGAKDGLPSDHRPLPELYGDLLFRLVAFGRGLGLNAEDNLREACHRFEHEYAGPRQ
ncbi:MAG: nucleoside triphosphate pyrophosphohydrolase [candidate division KSB1 bacterium]|nr:nucleoside triphosphate pyrophosphohydrolase [candidate division KSB1 bacterium]MDZ7272839.1 nucleoside triphosphate pyrophosphohydrolase [candidate division KSB1 bacterium]MDZ7284138.1 nucleoside triphosphate pyrophosphohydrolase [candidate division KSB1 bacterium]MDZ7297464.1 nucleoside triphosphate pyrophosphohydrolase [candidate division KSB1 bacterium]MDZ7305600.1 nucleoside triphosphate pyrophosphohydrolase [candidate division KSB1 bacterium]